MLRRRGLYRKDRRYRLQDAANTNGPSAGSCIAFCARAHALTSKFTETERVYYCQNFRSPRNESELTSNILVDLRVIARSIRWVGHVGQRLPSCFLVYLRLRRESLSL